MKIYVDFDGVIIDSETHLFDGLQQMYKLGLCQNEKDYLVNLDWYKYLKKCEFIKDSLEILKSYKEDVTILGKVCSDQEAFAKRRILGENDYTKPCIFVPSELKKSSFVNPVGNILIDDTFHNLTDWKEAGGIPIYFHKDGVQVDPFGNTNPGFETIKTLKYISKIKK